MTTITIKEKIEQIKHPLLKQLIVMHMDADKLDKEIKNRFSDLIGNLAWSNCIGGHGFWSAISYHTYNDGSGNYMKDATIDSYIRTYGIEQVMKTFGNIKYDESGNLNATYLPYGTTFFINKSPFANCQNFCIPNFQDILKYKEYYLDLVKNLPLLVHKSLLVVDVKQNIDMQALFGDAIIAETKYDSTNGSRMAIYVINCKLIK